MKAKFTMSNPSTRQLIETRNDAIVVVRPILSGTDSRFELVEFEKFNSVAKLRSQHYKNNSYSVISTHCVLIAGYFTILQRTVDVLLKKHFPNSKLFKVVLLNSSVILVTTKIEQGPFDFNNNYHLQHEKKLRKRLH